MANIPMLDTALALLIAGVPIAPCDGKRPVQPLIQPDVLARSGGATEVVAAFDAADGLAIRCGEGSGGIVCIDFDVTDDSPLIDRPHDFAVYGLGLRTPRAYWDWRDRLDAALLARLVVESTPSGGRHVSFRTDSPPRTMLHGTPGLHRSVSILSRGTCALVYPTAGFTRVKGNLALRVETLDAEDSTRVLRALFPESAQGVVRTQVGEVRYDQYNAYRVIAQGEHIVTIASRRSPHDPWDGSLLLTYAQWEDLSTTPPNEDDDDATEVSVPPTDLRPTTLFHATTPSKARRYVASKAIHGPVRGFTTLMGAMAWALKTGRTVFYAVHVDDADRTHKLPDHHNEFGEAWWFDGDVTDFECRYSASGAIPIDVVTDAQEAA